MGVEEQIHNKWKMTLKEITLEDALRCEGYSEDYNDGRITEYETREYVNEIIIKYSEDNEE